VNWLDIIILISLVVSVFAGLRRGLVKSVLSLAGLIIGVVLAGHLYKSVSGILAFISNEDAANIVAFILILVLVMVAAFFFARLLKSAIKVVMLNWVDRVGGTVFGLLVGAILWGAILAAWVRFFGSGLVTESLLASVLLDIFPLVLGLLPGEFDSIRNFFQ
jgi:membrane protein required for colicin V production|tara:strand:- start:1337 stop:1822 length:486 start_codon:yes stop_codon:yes gene_type:complete